MSSRTLNKGLGKGFDALLPQDFDSSIIKESGERIEKIELSRIKPSDDQPRTEFNEDALKELAESIKQHGVIQPLVVTSKGDHYAIVAGERRWRAAKIAEQKTVPVIVRTTEDLERLEIALVENVQRVDLSPLEQALSIERLHHQFSVSYEDIAKRLGKAISTVNNIVRLLGLPENAKDALRSGQISEGHARSVLALKDYPERQQELLENIIKYGWNVRQAEQFVTSTKKGAKDNTDVKKHMATRTEDTERLSKIVDSPVTIKRLAKGGRLEIHFATDEQLKQIIDLLSKN